MKQHDLLMQSQIETPIGSLVAIGDDETLYFLEFADHTKLETKLQRLKKRTSATIVAGKSKSICLIEQELDLYFKGKLHEFTTSLTMLGSEFQKQVWRELLKIPHGQTRSYKDIAVAIGRPTSYRAVAQANGSNVLPVLIPCHRVINSNGAMCGYGGGLPRKKWLLNHEKY